MSFSAVESGGIITLLNTATGASAEIFTFGALLNKFTIKTAAFDLNVIDGYASADAAEKEIAFWFKSARLSPFANRVSAGEYEWNGNSYKLTKHYLGQHAIHGVVYNQTYHVKDMYHDSSGAGVVLYSKYENEDEGYPFAYESEVEWQLNNTGQLQLVSRVTNLAGVEIPYMEGWHPYFKLDVPVDGCFLKVNASQRLELKDGIPTGKKVMDEDFLSAQLLKERSLDDCFVLDNFNQPACVLSGDTVKLSITCDESYPYLQVFTPDHRQNIAIENQSGATNAFNNKIGLVTIAPAQTRVFTTSYKLELT